MKMRTTTYMGLTAVLLALSVPVFANDNTVGDTNAGGTINLAKKGYVGTVDSFDKSTGVLRVKDGAGTVTTYKVASDTTITQKGKNVSVDEIGAGDSVTVYLQAITTSNELKRVELN